MEERSALDLGHFMSGKLGWYPFNRRLGGPQSWSGCFNEEKNLLPLPGF